MKKDKNKVFVELHKELEELKKKTDNLYSFIYSKGGESVSKQQRVILKAQAGVMDVYAECLKLRMEDLSV